MSLGVRHIESKAKVEWVSVEDDDIGFQVALGCQLMLDANFSANPAIVYSESFDEDDVGFGVTFHNWIDDHIGLSVQGIYWTDDGDIGVIGSLTIGF